ncbi:hypothetical protein [Bifidobacterium criceti]|uniref:Uncharacterized protein n=1 Tax=Bifidobacterium criceti TaxID=1960969 RepID=A0A2A2EDF1_9BIFI|nr:hypothetical protein [Bifidobacterium criceti]PAU66992.1 hypothetical protein B1526_1492 [Bifidobacterium criceti]
MGHDTPVEGTTPEPAGAARWATWTLHRLSGSPFRAKFRLSALVVAWISCDLHAHPVAQGTLPIDTQPPTRARAQSKSAPKTPDATMEPLF